MRFASFGHAPILLTACGLAAFAWILVSDLGDFRSAVGTWARRDLSARTQLAADTLAEPLATGDFRRIRAFGDSCSEDGVRLTVFGSRGGVVFDSATAAFGDHSARPEMLEASASGAGSSMRTSQTTGEKTLYCARSTGDFVVRLALPADRVFAPFRRARTGLVLAGLVGASGILLVFLFTNRLLASIREKERQLAELQSAEAFRREFVANLAHELKTPLTGIIGAVDLLDGGESLPDDSRRTLMGLLRTESARLDTLVKDILTLARLEHAPDVQRSEFEEADLADVMRTVHDRFLPRAEAQGVKLTLASAPSASRVCNAGLIEQALANLVENALRHSGSKTVTMALERLPDGRAVMSVTDCGCGIPAELRSRVFERFFRVDASHSDPGGTGLGLAIVKHIAQLHGGEARLIAPVSGGCRFEVAI